MAVEVHIDGGVQTGIPKPLFKLTRMTNDTFQYAPTADGRRFLVNDLVENDPRKEVIVVLNWPSEPKK